MTLKTKLNKRKKSNLQPVFFFLVNFKFHFAFLMILAICIGALEALNVALMYPILSSGLETSVSETPVIGFLDGISKIMPIDDKLVRYCVMFIGFAVLVFISKITYFLFTARFTSKVVIDTKQKVFSKSLGSDFQFFIDNKQGEVLYKIYTAPNQIASLLTMLVNIFVELVLSISIFFVLLSISWKATLIILIGGVIYYYFTRYLSIKVHYKAGKKKLESGQKETVIINEVTTGAKQIKVFETFSYWRQLFDNALHTYWRYYIKGFFWGKIPELVLIMFSYLAIGVVIIFIKLEYPYSFASILPLVGTFAFAVFQTVPKLSKFGNYRMNFMNVLPDVEAVFTSLRDTTYTTIKNGEREFKSIQSEIAFCDVTFKYKERDILLDNINLKIEKNKITALVGASGSGKSTIANLILRLFDVNEGGVFVDNINIKDFDMFTFFRKIGFVSQDTFIFNGTIRDNITFGAEFSDEEVIEAAQVANAHTFIDKLPQGYDTLVGQQGMRLSGGEQQRVAIARAMIRKPELLILDEATSSLDTLSEGIVQKAINNVAKNCTTFIIAHRLSTIKDADVIYVIDQGKIVERGTHSELMKKKGSYWNLYTRQTKTVKKKRIIKT